MSETSSQIAVSKITVGARIKFSTISPRDATIYTGTVDLLGNYATAKMFGDVDAAHLDMVAVAPTLPDPVNSNYFVVTCHDGKRRPFAYGWIANGSVELIEAGATHRIRLYNASDAKLAEAISTLRQNGFDCVVID